jgi:peptide chain release factor 3
MREFETESIRLGIPVTTRHNEVAPNQFECAPIFEECNLANDHNLLLMDIMEKVARKHNFRVLLHEKPFAGVNGSGKHNNWSLGTDTGVNLLAPGKNPKSNLQFLTFFCNTIKAIHDHADLLRACIAGAGNDHRLGANEAPPAIISAFIGSQLTYLLDEIEKEFGLQTYAVNWPIGMGDRFKGVFDRQQEQIHLFERSSHGSKEAKETILNIGDQRLEELLEKELYHQLKDELELLEGVCPELDLDLVHAGKMTPVFFGSAMTNFGVELFLNNFLDFALKPGIHGSSVGDVPPTYPEFTGFIFKLQANMDPKHRDSIAFVRVCTGKFEKDMTVNHARTGKVVRLSRPQKLFAQERESIDVAYPGDVIGLNNPGVFAIGDTIYTGQKLEYEGIPYFSPELFATLRNPNPSKFKQFQKGVSELREEGAVQIMYSTDEAKREPILAAVGQLQFEVVQFRLENEYGVETILDLLPYSVARWVEGGWEALKQVGRLFNTTTVKDSMGRPVLLFRNEWNCQQLEGDHPELKLSAIAPVFSHQQSVES